MLKHEFLQELRKRLEGLSPQDIDSSLEYYSEMIDDRVEDGMSEEEAVACVGSPADAANHILKDMPITKLVKARMKPKNKLPVWAIVLLILGSPIWASLLIALLSVIFSVYVVIWSAIIVLWAVYGSLWACGGAAVIYAFIPLIQGHPGTGLFLLGSGIAVAGLALFMHYGCIYATKGICLLSKKIFCGIKSCFIKKEAIQ